jgi:hypothetical protein
MTDDQRRSVALRHGPPDILTDGTAPTLEAAKAESHGELEAVAGLGQAGRRWLDWAKLEEVP